MCVEDLAANFASKHFGLVTRRGAAELAGRFISDLVGKGLGALLHVVLELRLGQVFEGDP